ncbi:FAD-binding domain-containing protein [Acephala macrosclerotiorum]|nr:FAD-binding domain-containing protein [Acephala macrosclerotiorum]
MGFGKHKTGAGVKKRTADKKKKKLATKKRISNIVDLFKYGKIPVFVPGEETYHRSVVTANQLFRMLKADCVVLPENIDQVQRIVKVARQNGIPITIKNGGHSYQGSSTADGGILLDLFRMNKVRLDMETETVTMQGGALWGTVYKQLSKDKIDGYMINGGRCSTVGVSGFILGGGLGPFTRSFGMGSDTLLEATVVTADGNRVTVSVNDDPESDEGKLFWALCGAGGGNFGVVVEMKLKVQKLLNKEKMVVAGRFVWYPEPDNDDEFLATMNNFYTTNWTDQMTIDSSWVCDLRNSLPFGIRFLSYYDGDRDGFSAEINPALDEDLAQQFELGTLAQKSSHFLQETIGAQWKEETIKSWPNRKSMSLYASFVFGNDRATIEKVTAIVNEELQVFRRDFKGQKVLAQFTWIHSGGQAAVKHSSDTAFPWRDSVYHAYIWLQWDDLFMEKRMRAFCSTFRTRLRPFSMMRRAAFINFPDSAIRPDAHERAYYGANRGKLQQVKQIWDKDNFFEWAQGVKLPKTNQPAIEGSPSTSTATDEAYESDDEQFSAEESEEYDDQLTETIAARQWDSYSPSPGDEFEGQFELPWWFQV